MISKSLPVFIFAAALSGVTCAVNCAAGGSVPESELRVTAAIFPEYDWVMQVLGPDSHIQADLLQSQGVDMHSFAPSAQDIVSVSDCDLFIYTGGESDAWVDNILASATNPDLVALNLMDVLDEQLLDETILEGMTTDHPGGHGEALAEADEHIWLSLRNAQICTQAIADALADLDPDGAQQYQQNADAYITALQDLDSRYQSALQDTAKKTILIADRYPFRYLVEDYDLTCYAAFPGCTAETEASFETVAFLTGKLDELDLQTVLVTESSDQKLADTIISGSGDQDREILILDSLQSKTLSDAQNGVTYLSVMEQNLDVLTRALG